MTLQQIKYVIGIAETGSLNKAAEKLYVSQPSLTATIHDLEDELGITIFNRTGRGVTLTNDGTEFLTSARQLYIDYQSVMEKYGDNGKIKKKFGVSPQHYSFAVNAFVDVIRKFGGNEYDFTLRETQTHEIIEDVAHLKSEVGVLYTSSRNEDVITKLIKKNNLNFEPLFTRPLHVFISEFFSFFLVSSSYISR